MIDNGDFGDRVRHSAVIAQAEGFLAGRHGLTVEEAAYLLKIEATTLGRPLSELAKNIIETRLASAAEHRAQGNRWHECGGSGD